MGPPAYSPYPRRLESLSICWCNYKGSTFYSVILRPWVLVRPESNSRPPAWQADAQPTEPPVRGKKTVSGSVHLRYRKIKISRRLYAVLFSVLRLLKLDGPCLEYYYSRSVACLECDDFLWLTVIRCALRALHTMRRDPIIAHRSQGPRICSFKFFYIPSATMIPDLTTIRKVRWNKSSIQGFLRFTR